jgi:hypothetical protein
MSCICNKMCVVVCPVSLRTMPINRLRRKCLQSILGHYLFICISNKQNYQRTQAIMLNETKLGLMYFLNNVHNITSSFLCSSQRTLLNRLKRNCIKKVVIFNVTVIASAECTLAWGWANEHEFLCIRKYNFAASDELC